MSYIRKEDYSLERRRPKLLTNYLDQMVQFLKIKYPHESDETISGFVKQTIRERMKVPVVEAVVHEREGCSKMITMPLDAYVRVHIADNNLTPSGTCYIPVSKKESFLRITIDGKVKERNVLKKLYLGYEAQGQKREAQYYYQGQANAKIFNNAIAGGMKITQFIYGCKAGFNAITSIGRISVKQGYSIIERSVNSNLFLRSIDDCISYVLNHVRFINPDFASLITNQTIYCPTIDDVMRYLLTSLERYQRRYDARDLLQIVSGLKDHERAYVFYAGCFNNLCRFNDTLMRSWIDSCFLPETIDPALYQDIDITEVKSFADDVITCCLSTNYKRLGKNPEKGTWNSLKDAAKFNPQGLQEFIYCCRHFVKNFTAFLPILKPIMHVQTTLGKLTCHPDMARITVPLSDTDSNIFSLQEIIRWKRGKIDFSQASYEMNGLTTFILSQTLEHVFARLSAGFGVEGKDVFRISMKNEFLYPILLATSLGKHYLAIATMQEGSILPNPRKDIKGVGFKSSTYPKVVKDGFEKFVVDLFAKIEEGNPIRGSDILRHIAKIEWEIYTSLQNRDSEYLQTVSVKMASEYKDPNSSQYFYYEFWQDVFAPDFGEMTIPNKCFKIPLIGGKKFFKNETVLESIKQDYPGVHERLLKFFELNPKRDVQTILIPPSTGEIHTFFVNMMDIRSHISQVMAGYYLVLGGLGIGTVDGRVDGLVSDFIDPLSEPIA